MVWLDMSRTIGTRMDDEQVCRMDRLARAAGMSRSAWMKQELQDAIRLGELMPQVLASISHAQSPQRGVNIDLGANGKLTPTQNAVYQLLLGHPDGLCRRDFATFDIWEVANRISEIEDRLGVVVERGRCRRHAHRRRVVLYRL